MEPKYTCPCCGYIVYFEPPGNEEVCPICFWIDNLEQKNKPYSAVGINKVSLWQGQKNYEKIGACHKRWIDDVRPAILEDYDENWERLKDKKNPKE